MEKRLLGGLADSASSRLVEQANIRAGLKRRYLLFGTISTFQAARMAVPSHRFRCLREIHVPAQWCCLACSTFGRCTGWSCFLPCVLLRGVAWPPPLGAVAFFLFFSVVLPSFPSFGWVFPSLQLGGAPWPPPSLGRGALPPHMMGWLLGVLGCWVGCWGC